VEQVQWTVLGANWEHSLAAPNNTPALEIATRALEAVWVQEKDHQVSTVGLILSVRHNLMKSKDEHIMVLSSLALANAGFHEESATLERIWEVEKSRHANEE